MLFHLLQIFCIGATTAPSLQIKVVYGVNKFPSEGIQIIKNKFNP